jgi:hypothetical protein
MSRIALASLLILLPLAAAASEPPTIGPGEPLQLPTPSGPRLRRPDVDPLPPSLLLHGAQPLQMPQSGPRPTLNAFPAPDDASSDDQDEDVPDEQGEPRLYLQHRR